MEAFKYRFLLWQLIKAIDTGKYDSLTFAEVRSHAESGTLKTFLNDRFGADLDLSMIASGDWRFLKEEWKGYANGADFGVENKGICLLPAYVLQGLQEQDR